MLKQVEPLTRRHNRIADKKRFPRFKSFLDICVDVFQLMSAYEYSTENWTRKSLACPVRPDILHAGDIITAVPHN